MINKAKWYVASLLLLLLALSCYKEQYKKDRKNKMTRRAKIASNYLANQAIELTQENIENKDVTARKAEKRKKRQQKELNELNSRSKVRPVKKHSGTFNLY